MGMKKHLARGFTLVELFAVIAVLAILVMITATIYKSVQVQARDAKNADAADKFADAIQLFAVKYQHYPAGGSGSNVAIGAGTECTNGVSGWAASGMYGASGCTIEDSLVASGYLPANFIINSVAPNPLYSGDTNGRRALMVYVTNTSGTPAVKKAMVMYSMEDPSADDTAHFDSELTKCGVAVPATYGPRVTYGMKNGVCVVVQTL